MKINLNEITKAIEEQEYLSDMETIKYADVSRSKSKLHVHAEKMVHEVALALKKGSLMQVQLVLEGKNPITFALETNIINLPLANYKKLINFFENEEEVPVKVYFETASEYVNASKFRIDLLLTGDELVADEDKATDLLTNAMSEKLKQIRETKRRPARLPRPPRKLKRLRKLPRRRLKPSPAKNKLGFTAAFLYN